MGLMGVAEKRGRELSMELGEPFEPDYQGSIAAPPPYYPEIDDPCKPFDIERHQNGVIKAGGRRNELFEFLGENEKIMKFAEVLEIIKKNDIDIGYMVSFKRKVGSLLFSDYFPEKLAGEKLFETEDEAWEYAKKFANATKGTCVDIYVIKGDTFAPVEGYQRQLIVNRE